MTPHETAPPARRTDLRRTIHKTVDSLPNLTEYNDPLSLSASKFPVTPGDVITRGVDDYVVVATCRQDAYNRSRIICQHVTSDELVATTLGELKQLVTTPRAMTRITHRVIDPMSSTGEPVFAKTDAGNIRPLIGKRSPGTSPDGSRPDHPEQ